MLAYHLLMSAHQDALHAVTCGFYRFAMVRAGDGWRIRALLAGYDVPF